MESQPQNPEFRNNPENFHPCRSSLIWVHSVCNIGDQRKLTLKAPIMTAVDDKFYDIFPNFLKKNKV